MKIKAQIDGTIGLMQDGRHQVILGILLTPEELKEIITKKQPDHTINIEI